MARQFIAWALVKIGAETPMSVLIRRNGATEPPNYHVPPEAEVNVQMLVRQKHIEVAVVDGQFVVRDHSLQLN